MPHTVHLIHPHRAKPFHRDGWVYEEKYDGGKIVAFKDGQRVRLMSRTGRDHATRFSDIAQAIAALPVPTLILDGEVCRFDSNLVSRFYLLSEPDGHAVATPPVFMGFDCLFLGGRDLRALPLVDRRKALDDIVAGEKLIYATRRLDEDGLAAWEAVTTRGYEGWSRSPSAHRTTRSGRNGSR
jgi:bifunctional non-homologous end joining protein LigD